MVKLYVVRKVGWDKTNERGVPLDCADIMNFFNKALEQGAYPLVPRTAPITEEEIIKRWVPNKDSTITYVAIDRGIQKVVCGGTLFLDLEKKIGELSITKDPTYPVSGTGTDVTKAVIEDAHSRGFSAVVHTSIENESMRRVMEKLGYKANTIIRDYEKYREKIKAKTFDVYEWIIPPSV